MPNSHGTWAPARTPAYCMGGDYGSAEEPKILLQVNAHRRHCKQARGGEPPMIQGKDGTWIQAGPGARLGQQLGAATTATGESPRAAQTPPPPPPPDESPPATFPFPSPGFDADPAPRPQMASVGVGKAVIPPPTGPPQDPAPVLFASPKPINFSPAVWELYTWSRQMGYTGTPDQCFEQAIKSYYLLRFGVDISARQLDPRPLLMRLLRGFEAVA